MARSLLKRRVDGRQLPPTIRLLLSPPVSTFSRYISVRSASIIGILSYCVGSTLRGLRLGRSGLSW